MTKKPKLLPWKEMTGEQAKYRLILFTIQIMTTIGLLGGIVFGYVLPALDDFQIYTDSIDLDKLVNSTKNTSGVLHSMAIITIIGLFAPVMFGYWLQSMACNFYDYMFRRLGLDIGYEQDTKSEKRTS